MAKQKSRALLNLINREKHFRHIAGPDNECRECGGTLVDSRGLACTCTVGSPLTSGEPEG